jgi:hypothetical protein
MYEFSKKEIDFLRSLGVTKDGHELVYLLKKMQYAIMDASNIESDSDYGAQVEGRKLAKKVISDLIVNMIPKKDVGNSQEDIDDYE